MEAFVRTLKGKPNQPCGCLHSSSCWPRLRVCFDLWRLQSPTSCLLPSWLQTGGSHRKDWTLRVEVSRQRRVAWSVKATTNPQPLCCFYFGKSKWNWNKMLDYFNLVVELMQSLFSLTCQVGRTSGLRRSAALSHSFTNVGQVVLWLSARCVRTVAGAPVVEQRAPQSEPDCTNSRTTKHYYYEEVVCQNNSKTKNEF